jgi:hypothetical protein
MICRCGEELEFMEYQNKPGLPRYLVTVGCPICSTMFYYDAETEEEVQSLRPMCQTDWSHMRKQGRLDMSYIPQLPTVPIEQLGLFRESA